MTTTAATRATDLTRDQLVAMHPYVIDIPDGKLAEGPSTPPTTVKDFKTTEADVDAIFDTHLPAFLEGRDLPVPLMVWAHGGLVDKAAGLAVANLQIDWWQANGVFPVHFVWETGLASSLWDAVKDTLPGRSRGLLEEAKDKAIEVVVRAVPAARATWGAMKTTARLASEEETGGAWYFAKKLAEFVKTNPGAITVHTAGHSAGSIFHSYLIPEILAAGVPSVASLDLLAPAIRVPEFKDRVMKKSVLDKIDRLAMFTMSEAFEKKDTCIGVYGKSLLYLIRASLEKESPDEILGLQECVRRDDDLIKLFGAPGSGSKGEVMWSKTVGGGPFSSTTSTSHGGFDNNPATMNSLARRILGKEDLPSEFPDQRAIGDGIWKTEAEAYAYIEARQAAADPATPPADGRRRALCIGIDAYPSQYRLSGCVADAESWKQAFEQAGFAVELLTNKQATRERMVERIKDLVVSSRAGDVLALQYSGHGTTVEDFNKDEKPEFDGDTALVDEAICPVDFPGGNLLIDDDLGEIWDLLPEGVSLTTFFDSCHSGGSQRDLAMAVPEAPDARARIVVLSPRAVAAYREKRGSTRTRRSVGDNDERGVFFAACQPDQVAWESNGQGDFTRVAVPLLRQAMLTSTNEDYFEKVTRAFGANPKQTPVLRPRHLMSRALLAALTADKGASPSTHALPDTPTPPAIPTGPVTARDRAIAQLLRSVAHLIET